MSNTKEQIKILAEAHQEAIDTVSTAIKDLYMAVDHLTTELRAADCTIAALKHVIIKKDICSAEEVENMQARIATLYNKKLEQKGVDKTKTLPQNMNEELALIHQAAKEASETPYDSQAFIFGG